MVSNWKFLICSNDDSSMIESYSPMGWDETSISLLRNMKYFGVFTSITVDLEFIRNGFKYIFSQYLRHGIDADLIIIMYQFGRFQFKGKLNFEDFESDLKLKKIKIDIIESSFMQSFLNRASTKFNILSDKNVDGKNITPALMRDGGLRAKFIFFYTQMDWVAPEETLPIPGFTTYHDVDHTFLFTIQKNDNPQVFQPYYLGITSNGPTPFNKVENSIYHNFKEVNQTVSFSFSYAFDMIQAGPNAFDQAHNSGKRHVIWRVNSNDVLQETVWQQDFVGFYSTYEKSFDFEVTFEPGDYLMMGSLNIRRDTVNSPIEYGNNITVVPFITYSKLDIEIEELSDFQETVTKTILPHELFTHLIAQCTGVDFSLQSNIFGRTDILKDGIQQYDEDGEWAYLGISLGKQVRGFEVTEIPTSFEEAFMSYSSKIPLGMKIIGETVYIEPLEDLFKNEIILDIGEVNELVIKPASEHYFNEVQIGDPEIEFEEVNGLDEYNTKATYINGLKSYSSVKELVSVYTSSCYAREFARRKQASLSGTEDTKYDNMIMMTLFVISEGLSIGDIELIPAGGLVSERLENVQYVNGIISPETAGNLRLAPSQCFKRWEKFLTPPIAKKDKTYYYQSKSFNSNLEVQTLDAGLTREGENIILGEEYQFYPEIRSCVKPVTYEMISKLKNNPLGLIKYTYEGNIYLDYLWEINGETETDIGNFRMLASRPLAIKESPIDYSKLPIIKYGSGSDDFVKYSDGENDFILYK